MSKGNGNVVAKLGGPERKRALKLGGLSLPTQD